MGGARPIVASGLKARSKRSRENSERREGRREGEQADAWESSVSVRLKGEAARASTRGSQMVRAEGEEERRVG